MTRGEGGVLEEVERQGEEWQGRSGDIFGDGILTCNKENTVVVLINIARKSNVAHRMQVGCHKNMGAEFLTQNLAQGQF